MLIQDFEKNATRQTFRGQAGIAEERSFLIKARPCKERTSESVLHTPDMKLGECALLRIWEVDPNALFIVLPMVLNRSEIEGLWAKTGCGEASAVREEVLVQNVLACCARPSRLAMCIEQLLDDRTAYVRSQWVRCPMIDLVEWWSRTQNREGSPLMGAFCWSLVSDPRNVVRDLTRRVLSEITVRALRFFTRQEPSEPQRKERTDADHEQRGRYCEVESDA